MRRTAFTILGVYLTQLVLAEYLWPDRSWSAAMIGVDAVAALIITLRPAGKVQSLIGLSFIPQIGLHLGRFLNGAEANMVMYFWGLSVLGFLQLGFLVGWWFYDRIARHRRNSDTNSPPSSSRFKAVGP